MINIFFVAHPGQFSLYETHLKRCLKKEGIVANLTTQCAPSDVDYIIYAPNSEVQDFTPYTRCKAVLNLWAGVETIVSNKTLTQPLCRMVDSGLRQGMTEWVTGHTLRYHLGMDKYIINPKKVWDATHPCLAQHRPITILGFRSRLWQDTKQPWVPCYGLVTLTQNSAGHRLPSWARRSSQST